MRRPQSLEDAALIVTSMAMLGSRHESAHGVRFDRTLDERWRIGSKGLSA